MKPCHKHTDACGRCGGRLRRFHADQDGDLLGDDTIISKPAKNLKTSWHAAETLSPIVPPIHG